MDYTIYCSLVSPRVKYKSIQLSPTVTLEPVLHFVASKILIVAITTKETNDFETQLELQLVIFSLYCF